MSDDAYILCVICRGTFTEEQAQGGACPRCGDRGIPADARQVATATLTRHEWRILCIWAENWAGRVASKDAAEGTQPLRAVRAIISEIKRQAPDIGPLSLREEMQEIADRVGTAVEYLRDDEVERFKPVTKQ